MTIIYDSKNHLRLIFSAQGTSLHYALPSAIFSTIIAAVYAYLIENDYLEFGFDTDGYKFFATVSSFLIVWQSQSAYNDMWKARNVFDDVLSSSYNCCMIAAVSTMNDKSDKADEWRHLYKIKMARILRSISEICQNPEIGNDYTATLKEIELDLDPNRLATELHELIFNHRDYLSAPIPPPVELKLHQHLSLCTDAFGNLTRFFTSLGAPFPIANMSTVMISFFNISVSLLFLDNDNSSELSLKRRILTLLLTFVITYAFAVVNLNAAILNNPFGIDQNCFSFKAMIMCHTSKIIRMLSTESVFSSTKLDEQCLSRVIG